MGSCVARVAEQMGSLELCLSNSLLRRDDARAKNRAVRILVATSARDRWAREQSAAKRASGV